MFVSGDFHSVYIASFLRFFRFSVWQVRQQVSAMLAMLCRCIHGTGDNFLQNMAVNSVAVTRMELSVRVNPSHEVETRVWPDTCDESMRGLNRDQMLQEIDSRWSFKRMQDFNQCVFRDCLNLVASSVHTGHRVIEYV